MATRCFLLASALGLLLQGCSSQAPAPPRPGPLMGCSGVPANIKPGIPKFREFTMTDPDERLGSYTRRYYIQVPESYTGKERLPVHFYFHGWDDDWKQWDYFQPYVNKYKFINVVAKGEDDGQKGIVSWNVGHGGRSDVCEPLDTNDTMTQYASCSTIGAFSPCNCYTCYDDFQFVADLYAFLNKELCIDSSRVYGSGVSNGAMFLYPLVAELAHRGLEPRFKAIAPYYGAFLKNMQDVPSSVKGLSIMHSHGTRDTEVPPTGGESADGWYYVPVDTTLEAYASLKGCGARKNITTPFDFYKRYNWTSDWSDYLVQCYEYSSCSDGRIARCDFHEQHGFWPTFAVDMMWWFFSSLDSKAPLIV